MHVDRGYLDTGRESVLDALECGTLLVIGPAGSGRTMLLEDLGAVEEKRRRRVWWCRGHAHGDAGGERLLRAELPTLLAEVADAPTTVLVDDAHLLDEATVERLAMLAARRQDVDLRMVATRRPVRVRGALAALDTLLIGPAGAGVVHLQSLTVAALTEWLRAEETGPTATGDTVCAEDLWRRTAGWPELVALDLAGSGRPDGPLRELVRGRVGLMDAGSQRIMRAIAFGLPTDSAALLDATRATTAEVDRTLDLAQRVGLLHGDSTPVECVAAALRTETPQSERDQIALAAVASGGCGAATAVATHLAAVGARSPAAATTYARAGDELQHAHPERALTFFDLAVESGQPLASVVPSLVACAAVGGQPRRAVELAAKALGWDELTGRARTDIQRAAGVAWAQLGRPDLAASCLVEAGESNLAVLALVAAGDVTGAATLDLGHASPADPTTLAAQGALAWARGNAQAAADALDRGAAITEVTGGVEGWPDSAHALGVLLALLALDGRGARRLAGTAVAADVGGTAFRDRHQLLLGWAALRAGRADEAHAALQAVEQLPLVPRDRLLALGLRAALTLRFGDPAELSDLHEASIDARGQSSLELYALDVAAELACLAARVSAPADSVLLPAERAADALGRPVTLSVPLAWARLVVALTVDDAPAARAAASELTDLSAGVRTGLPADLARAATTVADVLEGDVDADEVRAVADLLTARGRVFEAARLVGAAALRTTDTTLARSLLGDLRRLKSTQIRPARGRDRAVAALSDREREVARLVLDGRTHREIGAELYISAKTVEHHVANVRQKLGATTRAELLAAIREELART